LALLEGYGALGHGDGKVVVEIEAPATGTVHWTASLGETYPVGTQIGEIVVAE
jgi:pyruvate/2-oxoglutarate dehydrogenase complex dihydrolipoamide acyltransferase (E2) component